MIFAFVTFASDSSHAVRVFIAASSNTVPIYVIDPLPTQRLMTAGCPSGHPLDLPYRSTTWCPARLMLSSSAQMLALV